MPFGLGCGFSLYPVCVCFLTKVWEVSASKPPAWVGCHYQSVNTYRAEGERFKSCLSPIAIIYGSI